MNTDVRRSAFLIHSVHSRDLKLADVPAEELAVALGHGARDLVADGAGRIQKVAESALLALLVGRVLHALVDGLVDGDALIFFQVQIELVLTHRAVAPRVVLLAVGDLLVVLHVVAVPVFARIESRLANQALRKLDLKAAIFDFFPAG